MFYQSWHFAGVLSEPVRLLVEDVIAPEARAQRRAAQQREEGEAAADRSGLSLLEEIDWVKRYQRQIVHKTTQREKE